MQHQRVRQNLWECLFSCGVRKEDLVHSELLSHYSASPSRRKLFGQWRKVMFDLSNWSYPICTPIGRTRLMLTLRGYSWRINFKKPDQGEFYNCGCKQCREYSATAISQWHSHLCSTLSSCLAQLRLWHLIANLCHLKQQEILSICWLKVTNVQRLWMQSFPTKAIQKEWKAIRMSLSILLIFEMHHMRIVF